MRINFVFQERVETGNSVEVFLLNNDSNLLNISTFAVNIVIYRLFGSKGLCEEQILDKLFHKIVNEALLLTFVLRLQYIKSQLNNASSC